MAIDKRILDRMTQTAPPPEEDYEPEAPLPPDRHPDCAPLTGSWKQRKWAIDLRNVALESKWPDDTRRLLRNVVDATWWIANSKIVNTLKFKPPAANQLAGPELALRLNGPQLPQREMEALTSMSNMLKRDEQRNPEPAPRSREQMTDDQRLTDAERWAESISHKPHLAKAAILATLSRLYKDGNLKNRMRTASRAALAKADTEDADAKDIDAIERMLTQ